MVYREFPFHDNVSTTGSGNTLPIRLQERSLLVEIYGSATTRTIQFHAINKNGDLIDINGFNLTTNTLETQTSSTTPSIYQFDIEGLRSIQMTVSAISGGSVSVVGRVVE